MEHFSEALKRHIEEYPLNFDDSDSVLTMLYECHNENNPYDNEQIRADFNELYKQMNGMPLQEIDKIIFPFVPSAVIMKEAVSHTAFEWELCYFTRL